MSMNARAQPIARPGRIGRRSTARWDKRWRRFRSKRWLPRLPLFPECPRAPLRQNTTSPDIPHDCVNRHRPDRPVALPGGLQIRLCDRYRSRRSSARPQRGHDPLHLGQKEEPDWLLEWRLAAFRAWLKMTQPNWAKLHLTPIDYQAATYYSASKKST